MDKEKLAVDRWLRVNAGYSDVAWEPEGIVYYVDNNSQQ